MRVLSQPQLVTDRTPDTKYLDVQRIKDLDQYFRSEYGLSRSNAEKLSRDVRKNRDTAREWLPSGWFEELHPPKSGLRSTSRRSAVLSTSQYAHQLRTLMTPAEHTAWLIAGGDRAK